MGKRKKAQVIVISGPTAVGKTRLALALAKKLNGEIISADSVQVYRGLDVGSAKTPPDEREGIPHHLLDILDPTDEYTAGDFYDDARKATAQVLEKGCVPIIVGGTGLYLRWYLHGKADTPKTTPEISALVTAELKGLQDRGDWDTALELLRTAGDSKSAQSIERNDWYRLHRALTIIKTTGLPRSSFQHIGKQENGSTTKELDYDFQCYFLYRPRPELYRRIDLRCEEMLSDAREGETGGFLAEASWLLDLGIQPSSSSPSRAIGYRQAMEYLLKCRKMGETTPKQFLQFLSSFQKASRNYAKRQMSWFRNEPLFQWIDASQPLEELVECLTEEYYKPFSTMTDSKVKILPQVMAKEDLKIIDSYQTKNRIFKGPAACTAMINWIKRTQCNKQRG